jgi:hypothetical protein
MRLSVCMAGLFAFYRFRFVFPRSLSSSFLLEGEVAGTKGRSEDAFMAVRGGAGGSRPRSVKRFAARRSDKGYIRGFAKRFHDQDLATPGRGRVHLNARPRIS